MRKDETHEEQVDRLVKKEMDNPNTRYWVMAIGFFSAYGLGSLFLDLVDFFSRV